MHSPLCRLHLETLEDRLVPTIIDLTSLGASAAANGVVFLQASPAATDPHDEFLRLVGNNAVRQGYNSNHRMDFDEDKKFTRTVRLQDLVPITANGVTYRVIQLNIADSEAQPLLSLDELRLYASDSGNLSGFDATTGNLDGVAPSFSLNGDSVKFDARLSAGNADLLVYLPQSLLTTGGRVNPYIYLYSKFGVTFANPAGVESWGPAFGVVPAPPNPSAGTNSISGTVFRDDNLNGLNDQPNSGIREVTIVLTGTTADGHDVFFSTITAPDGSFTFPALVAGDYVISEDQPLGFDSGQHTVGTVEGLPNGEYHFDDTTLRDQFINIHLTANQSAVDYLFAEIVPPAPS